MSTGSQANILPQFIDPRKLAARQAVLQGEILAESCSRLTEAVLEIISPVTAQVSFGANGSRRNAVTGCASVSVKALCQRCLEPVLLELAVNLSLTLVWSDEEAKSLPKQEEPWLVTDAEADLWGLIEEELILALPIVSLHDEGCEISTEYGADSTQTEGVDDNTEKRHNPFEVLAKLKQ